MKSTEKDFYQRGFARAIGTEEAENFAFGNIEADIGKGKDVLTAHAAAKAFGEVGNPYDGALFGHNQSNGDGGKKLRICLLIFILDEDGNKNISGTEGTRLVLFKQLPPFGL